MQDAKIVITVNFVIIVIDDHHIRMTVRALKEAVEAWCLG